jgi:hypothetical protein
LRRRVSASRAGKGEHFLREARDVAVGSRVRKGDPHRGGAVSGRIDPRVGREIDARGRDRVAEPRARAVRLRLGGRERARVALEERHVRAEAAHGDLDREGAFPRHRREGAADQRGLAVTSRRDQEHLLAGGQIARQAVELDDAVDERRRRHHLAVDERILCYVKHRNDYGL